jgi:hypothetical protein
MWHLANRATHALGRFLTGVCLPFPPAGRPFHRFASSILDNLACLIGTCWMDVPFLFRCQGSRPTPLRALQFYAWAEFPQASCEARKPHANSPAQNNICEGQAIRVLEALFAALLMSGWWVLSCLGVSF